ncbi:phage tail protein [Gluconobacter albidus]|uniref:Phage tail protein n=1 Tax=Gluconobacter albidus TaxID=318683 RepID=A0A149TMQ2_9PROT|nr:phage tail protein [Gluconobacter albidus]
MGVPAFSAEDFRQALLRLLPRGAIWSRERDALPSMLATVWGKTFARNSDRASDLLTEAFPETTVELLEEWEKTTGLPDPCAGESPTLSLRRSQVVARLTDGGGSSIAYYIAFAAALGFQITISEYAPARADIFRAGDPVYGSDWAFGWTVNAPGYTKQYYLAGLGAAGEPLMSWGNAVLNCEITSRCPAHTIVLFAQSGEDFLNDFGGDIE